MISGAKKGAVPICPQCGEAATYQTPDGTFWDGYAHYWRTTTKGTPMMISDEELREKIVAELNWLKMQYVFPTSPNENIVAAEERIQLWEEVLRLRQMVAGLLRSQT
jgi:hypothetical protein